MKKLWVLLSFLFLFNFSFAQKKRKVAENIPAGKTFVIDKNLSDSGLIGLVQKQTFKYFWDFADPVSGMARERSNITNYGPEVAATGGTGFGVMSIIVAVNRNWITRDTAVNR